MVNNIANGIEASMLNTKHYCRYETSFTCCFEVSNTIGDGRPVYIAAISIQTSALVYRRPKVYVGPMYRCVYVLNTENCEKQVFAPLLSIYFTNSVGFWKAKWLSALTRRRIPQVC